MMVGKRWGLFDAYFISKSGCEEEKSRIVPVKLIVAA
jgi:hypothetical protein